jgi:hypothetical protein
MRGVWHWVLLNNPLGLACLVTVWGIGAVYALAALTGLLGDANVPLALKFCGIAGLALFVVVPILRKLLKV